MKPTLPLLPAVKRDVALSRREALRQTLLASLGLSATTASAVAVQPSEEPEFVPENDYPFFGGEPSHTAQQFTHH